MNDMDLQVRWDGIERRRRCVDGPHRSLLQAFRDECPEVFIALSDALEEIHHPGAAADAGVDLTAKIERLLRASRP